MPQIVLDLVVLCNARLLWFGYVGGSYVESRRGDAFCVSQCLPMNSRNAIAKGPETLADIRGNSALLYPFRSYRSVDFLFVTAIYMVSRTHLWNMPNFGYTDAIHNQHKMRRWGIAQLYRMSFHTRLQRFTRYLGHMANKREYSKMRTIPSAPSIMKFPQIPTHKNPPTLMTWSRNPIPTRIIFWFELNG